MADSLEARARGLRETTAERDKHIAQLESALRRLTADELEEAADDMAFEIDANRLRARAAAIREGK